MTFPSGSTAGGPPQCIDLSIVDDSTVENEEGFSVQISTEDPSIILNISSTVVSILDDDGTCTIKV